MTAAAYHEPLQGATFSDKGSASQFLPNLSLNHAVRRLRRNNPRQTQSRFREKFGVLLFRALAASGEEQHLDIQNLCHMASVSFRHHKLQQDHLAVFLSAIFQSFAAVAQNRKGLVVVPVVNNIFHQVEIAAFGNGLEEISTGSAAAGV